MLTEIIAGIDMSAEERKSRSNPSITGQMVEAKMY